jgi:hypothetical protein
MSDAASRHVQAGAASVCLALTLATVAEGAFYVTTRFFRKPRKLPLAPAWVAFVSTAVGTAPLVVARQDAVRATALAVLITMVAHPFAPGVERAAGVLACRAASQLDVNNACRFALVSSTGSLRRHSCLAVCLVWLSVVVLCEKLL